MNKEQAKIILSVREQISVMFRGFPDAREHFEDVCKNCLQEWTKPGAYFAYCTLYGNPRREDLSYDFDSPTQFYGRVDFIGRTIRVKTEGKEYMIDIDAARQVGLATEVLS